MPLKCDESGCAYLAPRGIVGVRRLASECGMGSGVSAGRSQPPLRRTVRFIVEGVLETECHSQSGTEGANIVSGTNSQTRRGLPSS